MRPQQWETFKAAVRGRHPAPTPVALIADSPWIPGYLGIGHLDYMFDPEVWFQSNCKIMEEFPEVIFFPSWWLEYGMAIEPSAAGGRIQFHSGQTPSQVPLLFHLEDVERWPPIDPATDGFMALALDGYQKRKQRIFDAGYTIPVATARGPLCMASFLRGISELMLDLSENPEGVHKLLGFATDAIIRWLQAQAEAIGPSVEGIFLLDDIPGMISRRGYLEFAHPYLKRICEAFPADWVKVYHNDANVRPFLSDLATVGFDVLNWTHRIDVGDALKAAGGRLCLMGNVAPLDLGVRGTPAQVEQAAREVIQRANGGRLILSFGGGLSPGTPKENILALVQAAREPRPD
ncbi:MAG: uroporphyrinogen decarboxylase family protein [Bryobacteraceae bacterium]